MVPQCSVSFPQKIYFDSISFKFAGNDHISSRFTSDITYLKSSSWWPKMQNLENPRKKGRKEERVVAVLKDGKRLGGFRAASWSQPPLSLFRTPSTEAPNCHSNPNASALSSPFSGSRLILDSPSPLSWDIKCKCTWRPASSNNMKRGTVMHCWIRFNNWDTSLINVVDCSRIYKWQPT